MGVKYEGCYTALVTPFRDGGIDFPALAALVDWQITSGVDGLVAVGTTGESATLTPEEHISVIAAVVKAARGRVPVIAGAGANSTAEALELTKRSEEVGVDGVLQVTPYYNRPTQEGLYRHFEAIARATKLPVILYNVPSRTGCDLLPETVERLAALPNVVSIKEATGSMPRATELLARVGDRMTVLSGDDATALPLYCLGGRGIISVLSNVVPAEMAEMWDAHARGDAARARELHFDVRTLCHLLFVESNPIPVKAALALMGKCTSEIRLPLTPPSPKLLEELKNHLRARGML